MVVTNIKVKLSEMIPIGAFLYEIEVTYSTTSRAFKTLDRVL